MKKIALLTAICVTALFAGAQSLKPMVIDYNNIARAVASNPENYEALLERFVQADTTLTQEECAIVYYGFSFRKGYNSMIFDGGMVNAVNAGDHAKVVSEAGAILDHNPVFLRANYCMGYAMKAISNPEWRKYFWRFTAICRVILSSGDGRTPETAFKVICVPDEYEILHKIFRIRGLKGQAALSEYNCDVVTVIPYNGQEEIKIYFNIERGLAGMKSLPE